MLYTHDLLAKLQQRLQEPLPGLQAHIQMAPSDRIDFNNQKMLYTPRPDSKLSAVMILCYPKKDKIYFPLIVRPDNTGVHSGQIALPGGKKDDTDTDLTATALRETQEEMGIKVEKAQIIGSLTEFYIPPSNYIVYPKVAVLTHTPHFAPNPREVAQIIEVDLQSFFQDCPRVTRRVKSSYLEREVPCYEIQDHIVWGATAVILSEFKMLLAEIW
ncbi:MAG: CoA pyrophosphatase [Microscillaceae bacterium]|nr:CoA pyrophosphatase [Microscillaceae bacterium]MDW8460728.1 CoA pyrophosphatase [Cytophagales bacterium]